jgi:hypothetical protein
MDVSEEGCLWESLEIDGRTMFGGKLELLQIRNCKAAAGKTKGWRKEIGEAVPRQRGEATLKKAEGLVKLRDTSRHPMSWPRIKLGTSRTEIRNIACTAVSSV